MILKSQPSALVRKEKMSPTSKVRGKVRRNKFVKKGGVPGGVESHREVESCKNRPRIRPEFVKSIRNGQEKMKNSIKSRPFRLKLAWRERRIKLDCRKKSGRGRMMSSKSFKTQEVREISGKEVEELRGFSIL